MFVSELTSPNAVVGSGVPIVLAVSVTVIVVVGGAGVGVKDDPQSD